MSMKRLDYYPADIPRKHREGVEHGVITLLEFEIENLQLDHVWVRWYDL